MISIKNLFKEYLIAEKRVNRVIDNITISFNKGESIKIMGPSGSGKSTLINLIGGMDNPTEGEIIIDNVLLNILNEDEKCIFRRKNIGIIFQTPNLHPYLNVMENIELPLVFIEEKKKTRNKKIENVIDLLGLNKRKLHYPKDLSGGEKQKVAIARALITNPGIILADEPTGNLDFESGNEIINTLHSINKSEEVTLIIVTHDNNTIRENDRLIILQDGIIISDKQNINF